ncbi:MAG TPA: long-chain-fatty-acid--CoA ligase [Dehalococcoidia bacterium]|jgi:acyl-CoA synthetase (AMP-forming)/AMP-acid ligase II|nr:long-chain-fatty-acid--CoA ligase [Dehalococcoidia bacterium]HIK89064.1 long-chain-fatty-acid--CoA ligase [Dehalococcoidia bacterium]
MLLHDYVDYHARETPDAEFAVVGDKCISYGEASDQINRVAQAFVASGIEKGTRFAILSNNSVEYVYLYYGASKAGVVLVTLNYRLVPSEWTYIINDAGAEMLFVSRQYQDQIDDIKDELESVKQLVVVGGKSKLGWTDFHDWITDQSTSPPELTISSDDDALQMYTSGTTGLPKGAVLSHNNLTANLAQSAPAIEFQPNDRVLIVMPLYHVAAAWFVFSAIHRGASLYIQEDFVPAETVRALDEDGIQCVVLAPSLIQICLQTVPDIAQRSYPDLRLMVWGASPIAADTLRQALDAFKCEFVEAYGMTELSPIITTMSYADHLRAMAGSPGLIESAGRAITGTEIRIVDEDDIPVANGVMGEIVVRGPQVMKGYWNKPEATAEAIRDGWMHTGDAGTLDDEGYLYIQDRIKDMIVSGGENVYPGVVEKVLFKHPAIADAAVIGVPDEQWGETVKAVVVLGDGQSVSEDEVIDFCRDQMGGFQRPRSVDFIDELPRNSSGKVLKRELREPYWVGHGRRVAGS